MKLTYLFFAAISAFGPVWAAAQPRWSQWFEPRTLRVDYSFSGDSAHQQIALDELISLKGWAGRRHNLDSLALAGNGQITMRDSATNTVIYRTSFSTLFQEWQSTAEAAGLRRSFENVFLLPMPRHTAMLTVTLFDVHRRPLSSLTHRVNPRDILIRNLGEAAVPPPNKYLWRGGSPDSCIDVAIVAEGYTAAEAPKFYRRAAAAAEALLATEPFSRRRSGFNILAVALPSEQSGVSVPRKGVWKSTALDSHFDTFYSERYLTTLHLKKLHNSLAALPYEHIIILANTAEYGGGGILNSYTLTAADHPLMPPVVVHEFGHSFGGLADEYFYDDQYSSLYPPDTEPWEPNITTLADFKTKWSDMLPPATPIPTPTQGRDSAQIGVYEGGGYQSKGVYRAFMDCRMKTNEAAAFCPVCRRALSRMIDFYTR